MQIPPQFSLTQDHIGLLTKIEADRLLLSGMQIPEPVKKKLTRVSLLKSSLFSARIEGNPLRLDEIDRTPESIKKWEVTNILTALSFINSELLPGQEITAALIQKLHALVLRGIHAEAGVWRSDVSAIFNISGVAVYMTPPPRQIQPLLGRLLSFIQSDKEASPLVTALIAHLIFEKIHPFLDGNGRVGRLLINAILKVRSWEFPLPVAVEEYFDEHKDAYYYHLDQGLNETEAYLKFMLEAFFSSAESLRQELTSSAASETSTLDLPPRQEELYLIIRDHGIVSLDFIHRRFLEVPPRTLRYDLKKLQEKKLIVKIGRTRGSFYKIMKS